MSYEAMRLYMFILSGKDMEASWQRIMDDDMPSISPEHVLQVWQAVVQLEPEQFVSVLFQFVQSNLVENRVLLITQEDDHLLVCNGIGSESLLVTSVEDVVNMLDWWLRSMEMHAQQAQHALHPVFKQLFLVSDGEDLRGVHLFCESHKLQNNTNLRLAQFQALCQSAQFKY